MPRRDISRGTNSAGRNISGRTTNPGRNNSAPTSNSGNNSSESITNSGGLSRWTYIPPRRNQTRQEESFRPSSPPPDFEIFPPVNWERSETRNPDGGFTTVYRGPGLDVRMNSGPTRNYTHTTTTNIGPRQNRRMTVAEAMRSGIAQEVTQLGFLLDDMENVIRRWGPKTSANMLLSTLPLHIIFFCFTRQKAPILSLLMHPN